LGFSAPVLAVPALLGLAAAACAAAPPPPKIIENRPARADAPLPTLPAELAGTWTGDWGGMLFRAEPDGTIRGVYPYDAGTITGRFDGTVLRGWWCQAPEHTAPTSAGIVELTVRRADDGTTWLDGRYQYGTSGDWYENWDLHRIPAPPAPELVARFDAAETFCRPPPSENFR
jgi:hypothetical protein